MCFRIYDKYILLHIYKTHIKVGSQFINWVKLYNLYVNYLLKPIFSINSAIRVSTYKDYIFKSELKWQL